ncbi:hypothetical protein WJX79_001406 [Trebouxia sp. C0005]
MVTSPTDTKAESDDENDETVLAAKLPLRQMTAIFFCQMNEATQITMPYTIAVYMVQDFLGPNASQTQISRLTGILAASFCAAQFVTSILLGYLSDTYGRRPIVIMSNISSLLSVLGFGMSTTYLSALLLRLSGGFCNFTFGCLKSMIGESMDLPTQALALGYLSLSWGFGTILGPSLGGALAQPCQAYGSGFPLCKPGQLFETRPFLLPCLSAAFISFLALQSSIFLLQETLPSKVASKYARLGQTDEEQGSSTNKGSELSDLSAAPARKPSRQVRRGDSAEEMHSPEPGKWSSVAATIDELSPMAGTVGIELVPQTLVTISASQGTEPSSEQKQSRREAAAVDRQRVWYQERQVQLTILGYGSIAFLLTPLFAAAPPAIGGVGLLASQLAVPLVFCGVVLMWYAVYGYPWFQRNYGAGFSCRVGLLVTAPTVLLIPVSHYFSWSVIAAQLALCLILGLKSMGAANAFSGSMILVNNASPKHAFGKVNGCGQMVASFVRAIGPAGAGLVWGGTAQLQLAGKHFMPFALVTAVALLTQLLYVFVKLPVLDK